MLSARVNSHIHRFMKTKKNGSYVFIALLSLLVASALWLLLSDSAHSIASNGQCISKAIDFKLPDYVVTDSDDNLERGASAWDCYEYDIRFTNPADVAAMESEMLKRCAEGGHWECADSVVYYKALNSEWDSFVEPRFETSDALNVYFSHRLGTDEAYVCYYLNEMF